MNTGMARQRLAAAPGSRQAAPTGRGPIAVVTSVPTVVSILTNGIDAYGLNRRTVSKLSMAKFLEDIGAQNLDVDLFFVPSLVDEWSQFDDGYLLQLINALTSGRTYDRVINVGQAVPLYRRFRPDHYESAAALEQSAVTFADTLSSLAALSQALSEQILEPKNFDRATYSFNTTQYGESTIVDMDIRNDWIKSHSPIWADGDAVGLSSLSDLAIPQNARRAAGVHRTFGDWLKDLRMAPLTNRFIYSDFKLDYDNQIERLWYENERLPGQLKILLNVDGVQRNSDDKLRSRGLAEESIKSPRILEAFDGLRAVLGDGEEMRMLDLAAVLQLTEFGAMPENPDYGRDAKMILRKFPYSVAFQKMWDRQSKLYEEGELNKKVNAWHVANTLLHAKMKLRDKLPPFTVWAVPVMPTNSVRFVLRPEIHEANVKKTLIGAIQRLARKQYIGVTSS